MVRSNPNKDRFIFRYLPLQAFGAAWVFIASPSLFTPSSHRFMLDNKDIERVAIVVHAPKMEHINYFPL